MKKVYISALIILMIFGALFAIPNYNNEDGAKLLYNYFIDFMNSQTLGTTNMPAPDGQKAYQNLFIDFLTWADTADVKLNGFPLSNGEWATWLNSVGDTANVMTLDTDDVIKLGQESEFGLHEFVPNSGYVPALDMQITPDAMPGNPYGYYFSVDSTKFLEIRGVANASGGLDSVHVSSPTYFSGKKCGAFAILAAQDTTTITTADTYQYVEGVFNDVLAEDFTQITVNTDEPAMRYDGDIEQWFKLDWSTNISGDSPNINAVLNFSLNGTPCSCTYKPVFCSSAGVPYAASSMAVVKLTKGDWIQLIVKTTKTGDEVTFYDFQLTICEFFD